MEGFEYKPEEQIKPKRPILHDDAYQGIAGKYVRSVLPYTEADGPALLIHYLTYFGTFLGRTVFTRIDAHDHFAIVFAVLVGDSGKGRKGTSDRQVRSVWESARPDFVKNNITSGLSSAEGLLSVVRDGDKDYGDPDIDEHGRLDPGVEDKRRLVKATEFSSVIRVMARTGNTLEGLLRQVFDGEDLGKMTIQNPYRATGASISLLGHMVTEELKTMEILSIHNGFANRILWIYSERSKFLALGRGLPPNFQELVDDLSNSISTAERIYLYTGMHIDFDDSASELWVKAYPELEEGRTGLVQRITQRASVIVRRLALIYAALDGERSIGIDHLKAALAVWEYSVESVTRLWSDTSGDNHAEKLHTALVQAGDKGMTRDAIYKLFNGHVKSAEVNRMVGELERSGRAKQEKVSTNGKSSTVVFAREASKESKGGLSSHSSHSSQLEGVK